MILLAACSVLFAAILFPVAGEFFIEFGREQGWYANPTSRLAAYMSAAAEFTTQTWILVLAGFLAGLVVGRLLDYLLRRLDPVSTSSAAESDIERLRKFGEELIQFHRDMYRFIIERKEVEIRERQYLSDHKNWSEQWEKERDARTLREAKVVERFGAQVNAYMSQLEQLSIPARKHLWAAHEMSAVALYFGQTGENLKRGDIEAAKNFEGHYQVGAR